MHGLLGWKDIDVMTLQRLQQAKHQSREGRRGQKSGLQVQQPQVMVLLIALRCCKVLKCECSGKTAENINMDEPRISETQTETGTAGKY